MPPPTSPVMRKFRLDAALDVGPFTEHLVGDANLFVDAARGSWLALDDSDARIMRQLASGTTLRTILSDEHAPGQDRLSALITRMVHAGLFGDRIGFADIAQRKQIQIHLTNRCNLRCVHCYMDSGVTQTPETETESWKLLLDTVASRYEHVFCSFSGGEPLMSSQLFPLLAHARGLGIKCAIITNGLLLTPRRVARLEEMLDVCAISLDGISAETHDQIRGQGTFARTMKRLSQLEGTSFRKVLNITVLRTNRDELIQNLHDFVETLPFHVDIDLGSLVMEGRGREQRQLALSPVEFSEFLLEVAQKFVADQLAGTRTVATQGRALWKSLPSRARMSCGYGDTFVFYADGSMSPCLTPRFIRGNVFYEDPSALVDVIERERSAAMVANLDECHTCDLRHVCGGRCHLHQLRVGAAPTQVECPDSYKQSMYRNLVRWRSSA